ncbi:hypothetical protein [Fibrobacter sp.]|uniref:McrB family protein n=1 Tax=Fibrobacter sp. TaxID=35828 RepID=UPI0025C2255D|nr:hypothetical protein [Fibrobacter sp.]MBR4007682.1 hypothetical protein [Fibrobacter sp.]
MAFSNKCIYNYIDTLCDTWLSWNDSLLKGVFPDGAETLNQALGEEGSNVRSRAKELFRVGFLKKELTLGNDALQMIRNDTNLQTTFGFLSGVIFKAYKTIATQNFKESMGAVCSILSVIQSVPIGSIELTINSICLRLLNKFPCPESYGNLLWLRWLLSGLFCELGKKDNTNIHSIESFFKHETEELRLSIICQNEDKQYVERGSFSSSDDIATLIDEKVSLTNILNQKAPLFILGDDSEDNPRGFYGFAFKSNPDFLRVCYEMEQEHVEDSPFKFFFDEDIRTSYKPNVIEKLNELAGQNHHFQEEYNKIMKNLLDGAKDALVQMTGEKLHAVSLSAEESISKHQTVIDALKTKPFVLLAGLSGTGKSRLVKELAYMSCPRGTGLDENVAEPGNYCLVEVKPNWFDSTELLGYYSNLSGRYELTKFVKFVYKAAQNPDVPFFVCLDEMNLAPVEQYFAEYLSVLETRKVVNGKIVASEILPKEVFSNCQLQGESIRGLSEGDAEKPLYSEPDAAIISFLKENGLILPENLFVIGTVNVDDTTHQFSRKVIDRAFTIEMNGGKLDAMFKADNSLEYREPDDLVPLSFIKPKYVNALDAMSEMLEEDSEKIKSDVPVLLSEVNEILNGTPFATSYRVENEMILYIHSIYYKTELNMEQKISTAFMAVMLQKVLPRVQGDSNSLKTLDGENVLVKLKDFIARKCSGEEDHVGLYKDIMKKIDVMQRKLRISDFTNFFG